MRMTQAWRVFPPQGHPTSGTPSSTARGWKTASAPQVEAAPQAPLGHPSPTPASWGTLRVPRSRSSWKHLNSTRPSWAVSHTVTLKVTPSRRGCRSTRRGCSGRSGRTGPLPPEASTSLGAALRLPSPPPGPHPGCLCRAELASPGSGEAAGTVPTPWAGRLAGAGRGQLERDSRPGSSITPGCPSGFEGVSWKGELRHFSAHRACHGGGG